MIIKIIVSFNPSTFFYKLAGVFRWTCFSMTSSHLGEKESHVSSRCVNVLFSMEIKDKQEMLSTLHHIHLL